MSVQSKKPAAPMNLEQWRSSLFESLTDHSSSKVHALLKNVKRLDIYQRNTQFALLEVLKINFENCHALLGGDYFEQLAKAYVATNLPVENNLDFYGQSFVSFLEAKMRASAELDALPYLLDVAKLDVCINKAFHAPPRTQLDFAGFAKCCESAEQGISFVFNDDVFFIQSRWPLHKIVSLNKGENEQLNLSDKAQQYFFIIHRPGHQVQIDAIEQDLFAMLQALYQGAYLNDAMLDSAEQMQLFLKYVEQGIFAGFEIGSVLHVE